MRYDEHRAAWVRVGIVVGEAAIRAGPEGSRRHARSQRPGLSSKGPRQLDFLTNDMAFSRETWFAATEEGLLASTDHGATWSIFPVGPMNTLPVRSVRCSADGQHLWVVSLRGLIISSDAGNTWSWHDLPLTAGGALRLDVAPDDNYGRTLVAVARNGLYISRDAGQHWQQATSGLPEAPVQDLAIVGPVFLASMQTGGLYISSDSGRTWARIEGSLAEGYFPVVTTLDAASTIFAASSTEGLYAVDLSTPRPSSAGSQPNP